MRLLTITLDGFKSYAHRQELSELDPHFNAITGLNGSGKSNVFDAICFVMGISNLKKVRAEDTRELIYKNGNAGIQRATVTIVFDNSDPKSAPPAYPCDQYPTISISRQILTGGKQKFFFNGRVSQQSAVKSFFHSVSLNVDNPHFLVLQGTVHKLVNMRSNEVLGWLEEAAGTRMFDARRRVAEHLIQGKQKKVDEIVHTIDHQIAPMLEIRKAESEDYVNHQLALQGIAEQRNFDAAYTYWQYMNLLSEKKFNQDRAEDILQQARQHLDELPAQLAELDRRKTALKEDMAAPELQKSEQGQRANEIKKAQVAINQRIAAAEKAIKGHEKALKKIHDERTDNENRIKNFTSTCEGRLEEFKRMKAAVADQDDVIAKMKDSLRLAKSGIQAGLNGMSLEEERDAIDNQLIKVKGELQRGAQQLKQLAAEESKLTAALSTEQKSHAQLMKKHEQAKAAWKAAEEKHAPYAEAADTARKLEAVLREQRAEYTRAKHAADSQGGVAAPLEYDPVPNVDFAAAIHGRVGELVKVKRSEHSMALSVAVTGSLMRVVISDDRMVQLLVEKGRLRPRTSFFPLNKVDGGGGIDGKRLRAAVTIAEKLGGWAELALNLVSFDNTKYQNVMIKVFGSVVLCSSMEIAQKIAHSPETKIRAVTIDGDVADPSGIMSGGSSSGLRDHLADFAVAAARKAPLAELKKKMAAVEVDLADNRSKAAMGGQVAAEADRLKAQYDLLNSQIEMSGAVDARRRLEVSQQQQATIKEQLANLEKEKKELEARKAEVAARLSKGTKDSKALEKEINDKLKQAISEKKRLEEEIHRGEADYELNDAKKADLEQRSADLNNDLAEKEAEMQHAKEEQTAMRGEREDLDTQHKAAKRVCDEAEESLQRFVAELREVEESERSKRLQQDEASHTVRKYEALLRDAKKEVDLAMKDMARLEEERPWIVQERDSFGDVNGKYYFKDEERTSATLSALKEREAIIAATDKRINKKATMLYDECKKDYDELTAKKELLINDRETILHTIQQVEKRKWGTLDLMVKKVSHGFSTLFASCLPGATCRLEEERAAGGHLTGLNVRVAFSGKEKESLTELSGGQRSLLALCLILAILRFRPAPMYILDEVDAALDPSHTQSIGKMLKEHFGDAQFLLVSLKDGMFNNANQIFEVRNTQGYSEITKKNVSRK